jgi:hypothetical protein
MDINNIDDNIILHEGIDLNGIEDIYLETLSVEDWAIIQSMESSFVSAFQILMENFNHLIDPSDRASSLNFWSEFICQLSLRFINFFRQIDEFESLHADDRFILIKYNLLPVLPISKSFHDKQIDGCSSYLGSKLEENHRRLMSLDAFDNIRDPLTNVVFSLIQITEQDPILLSLLLTVLIFTQGLSMNEDEPPLKDSLAVNRAQARYTKLLWNYLVNRWGEIQACRLLTELLTIIFRMQSMAKKCRECFRVQYMTSDSLNGLAPFMQTVLHIR